MFFEISALNGQNVQTLFNEVAKKLTGIETDLVKQTGIMAGQAASNPGGSAATDVGPSPAQGGYPPQNENRGFQIGGGR